MNDSSISFSTAGLLVDESEDDNDNENEDDDLKLNSVEKDEYKHTPGDTEQKSNHNHNGNYDNHNHNHENSNIDDYDDDEEVEEEGELFSMQDVITMLTVSWRNEKLAPDILEYEGDMVERVKKAIDDKESEIDEMEEQLMKTQSIENKLISASIDWYKKEIDRIRYVLHSYLRVRLWKIQKFVVHILTDELAYNSLSAAEQKFACKYSELAERNFKECFLKDVPSKYQNVTEAEMVVKPNLNQFVILKANENNDNILIEDNKQHVQLQKGSIFVSRYKNFRKLIGKGSVDLI